MASQFEFPRQQKPIPRPAGRGGTAATTGPRESNALRASVLDAALELGLVSNAGWMFDNVLQEENEEEDPSSSPSLTYGSSVTSEESFPSILSPSSPSEAHPNAKATFPSPSNQTYRPTGLDGAPPLPNAVRREPMIRIVDPDFHDRLPPGEQQAGIPFPESSVSIRPTTPGGGRKLKKKKGADGYESDGGYLSEAGKKEKKKKKDKEKEKEKKAEQGSTKVTADMALVGMIETSKEAKKRAKEEKKEAEAERKRTKSLLSAAKAARKKEANNIDGGYETDGGSKSKFKLKKSDGDASGYETDGTPVKRAKSRFFKLGSRASSKTDLHAEVEAVPPLPFPAYKEQEKEAVPLPIAERFATTLSPGFFNSPTSPSLPEGRSLSPFSLLSFQPLGASSSTPDAASQLSSSRTAAVASPPIPGNRNSQISEMSSTSSGSRSRAHADGSSKHQITDSGTSYSTITSSAARHLPSGGVLAPTVSASSSSSAGSKSGFGLGLGGRNALRPPAVSFSTSRSPSPSHPPPVAPLSIMKGPGLRLKASLDIVMARNASPSPVSPAPSSPFVIVPSPTASQSSIPSPKAVVGLPPSPNPDRSRQMSAEESGSGFNSGSGFRAKSPTAQSQRAVISAPNAAFSVAAAAAATSATSLSPIATNSGNTNANINININTLSPAAHADSPTHLIIPSSQYVVPSPRNSGLPSPTVLAYYDLPPPSPAPQGPLPTPPTGFSPTGTGPYAQTPSNAYPNAPTHLPSPAALRQRVIDRTPRALPPELSAALHGQATVQRGRESPFPVRPILPVVTAQPAAMSPTPGLEARMATRRYRDLYVPLPAGAPGAGGAVNMERYYEEKARAMELRRARRAGEREHSWIVDAENGDERSHEDDDGDEDDSQELQGVIERFVPSDAESAEGHPTARALGRRQSFDALQPRAAIDSGTAGPFEFEADGRSVGDRLSRWSGSIYSRASILDPDESGETRDRLVKQVEAMLDAERRGDGAPVIMKGERGYVPPVPRLPAAYANMRSQSNNASPGRSWNRF